MRSTRTPRSHPGRHARPLALAVALAVLAAGAALVPPATPAGAQAPPAAPEVVVSLTWDDGRASQVGSLPIQHRYGFPATYYVNSAMVGDSDYYLTKGELDQIAATGGEIGGHTERHDDLTTLSSSQARTAICADRQRLTGWYGPEAGRSFAYPFGAVNQSVEGLVQECGYQSGRGVGGVRQTSSCLACPPAETIPTSDPYRINTISSVTESMTLADLQGVVGRAETAGGGWVVYVLHSLGHGEGDTYSIDPAMYDQLLAWLAAKPNVRVATVADALAGPPAPPLPDPAQNLLRNPGLEADDDHNGVADCWTRTGYGTNQGQWSRTSNAHTGSAAEQLTMTSYTSGDRKLLPTQDGGTCSPAVSGDRAYLLQAWYQSTAQVRMVVFYRNPSGSWVYWRTGPVLATSSGWARATLAPGPLPPDARALSFGLALTSTGTLRTDDHLLVPVQPPTPHPDTTPPTVALTEPADGSVATGGVVLAATAGDETHLARVDFLVGGQLVGSDATAPFTTTWDSTTVADGPATIVAVARDGAGNSTTSAPRSVVVDNDVPAPTSVVRNPSLEQRGAGGEPTCWTRTGYGVNTFQWSSSTDAHTGASAERLDVTARTSGDRKLLIKMDAGQAAGGCAPDAVPGHRYEVSTWYRSTTTTGIVVFYRNTAGTWAYWQSSWLLPASTGWSPATYTTPPLPADATALSFGMYLAAPGSLWTDDYGISVVP